MLALAWIPFLLSATPASASVPWPSDLVCLLSACAVGVLPGVVALWFVAHAVPHRPGLAVLATAAGAVGLGALAAKASCPMDGLRHLVFGHALAPIVHHSEAVFQKSQKSVGLVQLALAPG